MTDLHCYVCLSFTSVCRGDQKKKKKKSVNNDHTSDANENGLQWVWILIGSFCQFSINSFKIKKRWLHLYHNNKKHTLEVWDLSEPGQAISLLLVFRLPQRKNRTRTEDNPSLWLHWVSDRGLWQTFLLDCYWLCKPQNISNPLFWFFFAFWVIDRNAAQNTLMVTNSLNCYNCWNQWSRVAFFFFFLDKTKVYFSACFLFGFCGEVWVGIRVCV